MTRVVPLILLCAWLAATGCGVVEKRRIEAQDQEIYNLYRQYMEALNLQRRQAGVPPLPVRSYEDWRQSPGTD